MKNLKDLDAGNKKQLSIIDYGFHFVLKCMKLKCILLDQLWVQRCEDIEILEDLIDVVSYVNINMNYKVKFGDAKVNSDGCWISILVGMNIFYHSHVDSMPADPIAMNHISKSQCHEAASGCDNQEQVVDQDLEVLIILKTEIVKQKEAIIQVL